MEWAHKAAEQGDVKAQSYLAYMYAQGIGVTKDEVTAADWYRKAAKQGSVEVQEK